MQHTGPSLSLYAGPAALRAIREQGIHQDLFSVLVGASGGPKWFVLYGLDRYLFGDFFANRSRPLSTVGSSAGAWRMACLSQADPLAAIDRLAYHYSRQNYSLRPSPAEVSSEARRLLIRVLGESGTRDIVENPHFRLHIFAERSRWAVSSERRAALLPGLALSGAGNTISRRLLRYFFERIVFYSGDQAPGTLDDLPTRYVPLSEGNLCDALMASGSIPMVLEGVEDIEGAPKGVYRDGGIIDYHFDLPFSRLEHADAPEGGLVLYPHFYPRVTPGWFDKHLPWRRVDPAHFANVLLLAPSPAFVESLPYGKIPDRRDFETLDHASRMLYWRAVMQASARLAEEFAELVEAGPRLVDKRRGRPRIQPFDISQFN